MIYLQNEDIEAIEDFVNLAKDMTGRAAGAAFGFIVGGLPGAMMGSASVPVIQRLFKELGGDLKERMLAPREKVKIGLAITFAADKIRSNLESGQQLRDDGFFQSENSERSAAEEIVEGVLFASQREHEEKKIKYYGNAYANLGFKQYVSIGRSEANALLRASQNLSYREICILAMIGGKMRGKYNSNDFRQINYRNDGQLTGEKVILLYEIYRLYNQGMVNFNGDAALGLSDVNPSKMMIQGVGAHLYNLMELSNIPDVDYSRELIMLK